VKQSTIAVNSVINLSFFSIIISYRVLNKVFTIVGNTRFPIETIATVATYCIQY